MIHVVNGPNLNLLGRREPAIYGTKTLKYIQDELEEFAFCNNEQLIFFQSKHEGELLDYLQKLNEGDRVILNPGALAHSSICLRDCIAGTKIGINNQEPACFIHQFNVGLHKPVHTIFFSEWIFSHGDKIFIGS